MNKVARMIVMSGMAAAAAVAFSAGPAAAASDTAAPAAPKSTTKVADKPAPFGTRIAGYYRSPIACNRAGRVGEWRNQWDNYRCYPVRFGFKRGYWALQVSWNHGGFPGHHGPIGFPGHPGPGFPGHHGPQPHFPPHHPNFTVKK
ncbi:hypothetical protein BJ973_006087 [Actinoplanes tereljensis]|uniref:Uncharacterized protein n=1 Tax=Paractinoplanes tereljensis TaxID=571912 RepID=A0A919TRB3_9ACTN|nr:hypothetical protein [Actinoplanes tereljensis]GIF19039.1 hypothetical protein Ate02nite_17690 [Actinoplanes tereljensis]